MHCLRGSEAKSKDGDVVFLAERLRCLRNFFSRLQTELRSAVEAEELAG